MDPPSESNTLTATALFAASVAVDAFTAHDRSGASGHAPTSLRASSLVLVACLAAPPIREWMLLEQRAVSAALLIGVTLGGAHAGSSDQRDADAIYVAFLYAVLIYTFWSGGTEKVYDVGGKQVPTRSKDAAPFVRREALINLAVSSLFYASLRVVRLGFDHPLAARGYTHATTAYDGTTRELQGYAYSSSTGVTALCFGAAVGVGTAVALFVSTELRTQGTAAATMLLTASATAQLTAAFVATLVQSEALDNLPAIWSTGACASASLCPSAHEARRLSLVNQSSCALWLNGLGTFVLAYAPSLRFQSRVAMLGAQRNFEMFIYALIGTAIAVASLLGYLAFTGAEALTDYALVGATISVFVTAFVDSRVGGFSFVLCLAADVGTNWATDGAAGLFTRLSRCYSLYVVVLLLMHTVLGMFVELFWRLLPQELVDAADRVLGVLVIAGTSAAAVLYLEAAGSAASYDGQMLDDAHLRGHDNRYARTSAAAIVEHWLPLLVWLPLYGCRCEVEFLSVRTRAIAWYGSALVPVLAWFIALLVFEAAPNQAVGWSNSGAYLLSVLTVAVVPWSVLVWA